jgi:hypothetical protein
MQAMVVQRRRQAPPEGIDNEIFGGLGLHANGRWRLASRNSKSSKEKLK